MAPISVDRVIRSLDEYSENEIAKLRSALDKRSGITSNQISSDDLEALQNGTIGTINTLRQQRDHYKGQLKFYEEYFPKQWIAYVNGKTANQGQTRLGIAVMLHEVGRNIEVLLMEGISPSPLELTQDNITTNLFNAIGMIPETVDIAGQHLDGLYPEDWKQIFLELTPYRYTESLKPQFSEKQAELFGRYYPQIQTARSQLKLTDELRGKTQDHFNKIIKRTFERREERGNKTKFIVRKISD